MRLQSATDLYRQQQRVTAAGLVAARRARATSPDRLLAVMLAFQQAAVEAVVEATPGMLAEQSIRDDPVAGLVVPSLLGAASDGRSLGTLLTIPDLTGWQFDQIVQTQLSDVARHAAAIERAVRAEVTTYVRALNLPSCGRCVVLAGRPSSSATPFRRHPRCDCYAVPTTQAKARWHVTAPRDAFDAMSRAEREKSFTKAGAEAIKLGADPQTVVNARRGMNTAQPRGAYAGTQTRVNRRGEVLGERPQFRYAANGRLVRDRAGLYTTTESSMRRGLARQRMSAEGVTGPRLMPESILEIAEDRDDAIRLLRAYGYIT